MEPVDPVDDDGVEHGGQDPGEEVPGLQLRIVGWIYEQIKV